VYADDWNLAGDRTGLAPENYKVWSLSYGDGGAFTIRYMVTVTGIGFRAREGDFEYCGFSRPA